MEILVNDTLFRVRENLYHFLLLWQGKIEGSLWIDQICIDQANNNEKNHQVSFMSRIYRDASLVVVWLGVAADDSDAVMTLLSKYIQGIRVLAGFSPSEPLMSNVDFILGRVEFLPGSTEADVLADVMARDLEAVFRFLERSYWHRVWIVQEILLASELVLACGTRALPWSFLSSYMCGHMSDFLSTHLREEFRSTGIGRGKAALTTIREREMLERHFGVKYLGSGACISSPYKTLQNLLERFQKSNLQCEDQRDKVYGLLSLIPAHTRIEIRYDRSAAEVCEDVIRKVIQAESVPRRSWFLFFGKDLKEWFELPSLDVERLVDLEISEWSLEM